MAMNPLALMKLAGLGRKFKKNHPKVVSYLRAVIAPGLPEGSILEITVTKPGAAPVTTNMRVTAEDIELLQELRELQK